MKKISLKQILTCCAIWGSLIYPKLSQAVDVGDVFYSDGTFSSTITEDANKLPIGLVYWVGKGKDHGLIMSLKQPADMNYTDAYKHCNNYEVLGTDPGSWRLPDFPELIMMGNEIWNGVKNNKFTILNDKLSKISIAQKLVNGNYIAYTQSSAGNYVDLSSGTISQNNTTSAMSMHVRCVRSF